MKYTKCPTCGGDAMSVSGNFEKAGVLIEAKDSAFRRELKEISAELVACNDLLKTKINELNSDQLFFLYRRKLHEELRTEQIRIDEDYYKIDEQVKIFNEGLRKMLGDL